MDKEQSFIEDMHKQEGREKIEKLEKRIDTTKYNIEASEEIIANTPSDAQRDKLIEKNTQRRHAIGSINKEIRDIEQELEQRSREIKT